MKSIPATHSDESFPPSLKDVAPFQIIVLMSIVLMAANFISLIVIEERVSPDLLGPVKGLLFILMQFAFVAVMAFALPQFRAALPVLFSCPKPRLEWSFLFLALLVALTWAFGLHAILVVYASIVVSPSLAYGLWAYAPNSMDVSATSIFLDLLAGCVLAPIVEEILNRGLVMGALKERYGLKWAIVLSSIFFGVFHFKGAVVTAVLGAIYALVAIRYRSLFASILLHAVYNSIVTVPALQELFLVKDPTTAGVLSSWTIEVFLAIICLPLIALFVRRL